MQVLNSLPSVNNSKRRNIKLDLSFLPAGDYTLEYWRDTKKSDTKPASVEHKTVRLNTSKALSVGLAAAGGYVAIIRK